MYIHFYWFLCVIGNDVDVLSAGIIVSYDVARIDLEKRILSAQEWVKCMHKQLISFSSAFSLLLNSTRLEVHTWLDFPCRSLTQSSFFYFTSHSSCQLWWADEAQRRLKWLPLCRSPGNHISERILCKREYRSAFFARCNTCETHLYIHQPTPGLCQTEMGPLM